LIRLSESTVHPLEKAIKKNLKIVDGHMWVEDEHAKYRKHNSIFSLSKENIKQFAFPKSYS
jgi:hypothetical protein